MKTISRAYAAAIDDVSKSKRELVAVVSNQEKDRYGTVLLSEGCRLDAYKNNPVVLWAHGKDPRRGELPIGKSLWTRIERGAKPRIVAKVKFADDEFSRDLFALYENKFCNAWSIQALPTNAGRPTQEEVRRNPAWADVSTVYRKFELLELSACGVPGNSECLTLNDQDIPALRSLISRGMFVHPEVRRQLDAKNRPRDPKAAKLPPLTGAKTFDERVSEAKQAVAEWEREQAAKIKELAAWIRDRH